MQTIIVNIDAEANVTVESQGVKGAGCQAVTAAIEAALGKTTGDVKTAEYSQPQAATQRAKAHG